MREAVIIRGVRTAVGKAPRGSLRSVRPDDLGAIAVRGLLDRVPPLDPKEIDDVIIGCAMPEAEQGMNVARIISFRAGLPNEPAAMTVNRYCASGLQSIALASDRIRVGGAEVVIAGGVESMSFVPMGGNKVAVNPSLMASHPGSYMSMGLTAERVAKRYAVTREEADVFSYRSHEKATTAIRAGRFKDEIVGVPITSTSLDSEGKVQITASTFDEDEGPRQDTSVDALSKLPPVFHAKGSVTAGNSSQTSDGAAATLVMSEDRARALSLKPLARFVAYAYSGCAPEEMGIGPVHAIPKVLKLAGLRISDIDLIELNEAFAAQSLAVIKLLELDPERVNVNGGAIALGHPLGCTGTKLTVSLLNELKRRKARFGMVTMCVGGGMGAAGIFENLQN